MVPCIKETSVRDAIQIDRSDTVPTSECVAKIHTRPLHKAGNLNFEFTSLGSRRSWRILNVSIQNLAVLNYKAHFTIFSSQL